MSSLALVTKEIILCTLSWLVFAVLSVPLVLVFLVLFIYKCFVNLVAKILHPEWIPLDGLDIGCAWAIKADEGKVLPSIGFTVVCQGDVNIDQLRNDFNRKILSTACSNELEQDENGVHRIVNYDRLKKVPKHFLGYFYWSEPLDKIPLDTIIYESVHHPSSSITLDDFISTWIHEPYINDCGLLWEICVCKFPEEYPGKAVVLLKMLHLVGDGYAGVRVLTKLCNQQPFVTPVSNISKRKVPLGEKIIHFLIGPRIILQYLVSLLTGSDCLSRRKKYNDGFTTWLPLDLKLVKQIRRHLDCKFDDIFHALIGISYRRYLTSCREQNIPEFIPIVTPVSWPRPRDFSDPMRNRMSTSIINVPIDILGTCEIIKRLSIQSASFYRSAQPLIISYFCGVPALVPICSLTPPSFTPRVCTAYSALPPISNTLTISNCEVESARICSGLQMKQSGLLVGLLAYKNTCAVSILGNKGIFPSRSSMDKFTEYFMDEFKKLEKTTLLPVQSAVSSVNYYNEAQNSIVHQT